MKYQIPSWHGDDRWTDFYLQRELRIIAEIAAEVYVGITHDMGIVDSDKTLLVRIMDDNGDITEWRVSARSLLAFDAEEQKQSGNQ